MFDYTKTMKKLNKFDELPERKQRKFIRNLFTNDDLYVWLFDYSRNKNKDIPVITNDMVIALYNGLTMPNVLKTINWVIEDEGYESFSRSTAVFLNSISESATDRNNNTANDVKTQLKNDTMTSSEARSIKKNLEKYVPLIDKTVKSAKKINKPCVKRISKECNIPKDIVTQAFLLVPDAKLIPNNKVQFYLNAVITMMYEKIAEMSATSIMDAISYKVYNNKQIRWKEFFIELFGKEKLNEVSTCILLEGVNRVDKYKDSLGYDNVYGYWVSLSDYALSNLDRAPENVRDHMIQLYIKKINSMFKNRSYDLRIDLLKLPEKFKNLIETVSKFSDEIKKVRENK